MIRLASVIILMGVGTAHAASFTWDGSNDLLWATKQNWTPQSGATGPVAGDILTFNAASAGKGVALDLGSTNRAAASMTFSSAAGTSAFSFSGTAGVTLTLSGGLTNNDTETQTFNVGFIPAASQTWNAAAGGFSFAGGVSFTTAITLTLSGTNSLTVGGAATLANDVTLSGTNGIAFNGTFTNSGASRILTNNSTGTVALAAVNLSESLTTGRTLTIAGSGNTAINGTIANGTTSAASGLTKSGTGTLTVAGNNSYTGTTTLSAGTLRATTSANALGTGAATLALGGGTLELANDSALNFARNTTMTATANLVSDRLSAGAGTTHTLGTLALGAQTLSVAAGSNVTSGTAGVTFGATTLSASGAILDVGASANLTLGALGGNFDFSKQGAGQLTLNTTATRSAGTTTLTLGTLELGTASALGTNAAQVLALNGGTLNLAPTSDTATTFNATSIAVGGNAIITSSRGTAGAGLTHTVGALSIGANTLTIGAGANVNSGTGGISFGATTLTGNATIAVNANALSTLGAINDGGATRTLTKDGAGLLMFTAAAGSGVTSGTALVVSNGTVQVNAASALTNGNSFAVTVNALAASGSAAFNLNNVNETVASLTFGGAAAGTNAINSVATGSGTLTLAGNVAYSATNNPGGATVSGNLSLAGADRTFSIGDSASTTAELTISAAISGAGGVIKTGDGALVLSGTNNYIGKTSIQAGSVTVSSLADAGVNSSLGAATANSTIDLGAAATTGTLIFNGVAYQSTNRIINLAGTTGGGTIDGSGSGLAFTSDLTATGAGAKTLTLTGSSSANAFSGAIVNGSGTTALTKDGAGTWTLNGAAANTFTGVTTINGGTLVLNKTGGALAIAGNIAIGDGTGTDTLQLGAANQIATTSAITFNNSGGAATLNLDGYSQTVASISSTNTSAAIQLGTPGSATTFTVGDGNDTTFAGAISGGANAGFAKQGTGTVTLNGTSSFSGGTTISAGALNAQSDTALGTGNVTVGSSATLQLQAGGLSLGNGSATVTLGGNGTGLGGNNGALINVGGGTTRLNNNVALSADSTISSGATSGATLVVGGSPPAYVIGVSAPDTNTVALGTNKLTFAGAAGTTTRVDSNITGSGGVDVNTSGTVHYNANKNTYTGTTNVLNGTLLVDTANNNFAPNSSSTSFWGVAGNLVIGDATGAANSAVVQLGSAAGATNDAIKTTAAVTVLSDGYLNLNSNFQNVGKLTMAGGTIGGGTLYLDYANTSVDITPTASSGTAVINGALSLTFLKDAATEGGLPNQTRTFNVGHHSANTSDLTINALVGNGSLIKTGSGTMTLATSANTYAGSTTVNGGILDVRVGTENVSGANRSSLGAGDSNGASGAGTTVNSGGTLQLQGGIAITHEQLTLNGTGFDPGSGALGALNNLSGSNTWGGGSATGTIALGSDATIASTAGSLTIATTMSSAGSGYGLTVAGAGNTTISGSINTGTTGTVTKAGAGTLVLSGASGYQGATQVDEGVLSLQNNFGLGAVSTGSNGTFVANGAELQLSNAANGNLSVGGEALSIQGAGLGSTGGALHNVAGNNAFGGLVTLSSAATIMSDAGTTLTLSGGTASGNHALTVTGGGSTVITGAMANGTGALTKNGAGGLTFAGSVNGTTGTVGATHLLAGTMTVGNGAQTTTLNTGKFDAAASTTLMIASGGTVVANYADGSTTFAGAMSGSGEFVKTGAGTLVFDHTFTASNLTLTLNGGTLSLLGGQFTFGTIHITGNTVLDFNNSAGTFLSSASLVIDAGVTVTVNNWTSIANNAALSTVWYAGSTVNGGTLGGINQVGGTPLNQIVFTNYGGLTTTWVSGTGNGWFDHEIRPTPEPGTYGAIFISGCLGLLGWRRYRRNRAS